MQWTVQSEYHGQLIIVLSLTSLNLLTRAHDQRVDTNHRTGSSLSAGPGTPRDIQYYLMSLLGYFRKKVFLLGNEDAITPTNF